MQSRRHEDYGYVTTSSKLRNQHGISEMGHDPDNRDAPDRTRRSLSPPKLDGSRGALDAHRRSGSSERRDYGWHLGGGRTDRFCSRSPQYEQMRRRPHLDDGGVVHRKYGYHEDVDFDHFPNSRLKHVYGYDHGTSRVSKENDYSENRVLDVGGRGMLSQKSIPVEDDTIRGSYRLPPDASPTTNYGELGGSLPLSSRSMDIGRYDHEKLKYREQIPLDEAVMESYKEEDKPMYHSRDKLPAMESYKEGEKPIYRARDILYTTAPASYSKDFGSTSQYKDFAGTSSRALMNEFSVSYRDSVTSPASDGYPRSSVKLTESIGFNAYEQRQRPHADTVRDTEVELRNSLCYHHGAYSPSRTERKDYAYPETRMMTSDEQGYPSDDLQRVMPPRTLLDYNDAPIDYDHRDLPRSSTMLPVVDRTASTEHSYGNWRTSSVLDYPSLQKQSKVDYFDMGRNSYSVKQDGEYLNCGSTHAEFERTVPQDYGISPLGVSQDRQISYLRSDYGFGRDAGQEIWNERLQSSSDPLYDSEMHKLAVRTHRIKEEELGICEPSNKVFKRKISMEDNLNSHTSRTIMSSKWSVPEEFEDLYDGEEYIGEDMSGLHSSKTGRYNHNEYRKAGKTYDGRQRSGNFSFDDRFSSRDSLAQSQRSSVKSYKHNGKYIKGQAKPSSLSWHNVHHSDRRNSLHKQQKVWKRNEDYDDDVHEIDADTSKDWLKHAESEPSQDSKEFKELIHKAFLDYCKKLNVNSSVRRRYKEQGKAGSLFCITCGRSLSKEFMDTQRLVTHCFMSHKVGLRAQHIGLYKAICVLLGWNSFVPQDTVTWVPEALPDADAVAQKEDLILWPPLVIIRNISMSNTNPMEQKVIPIEAVEAFLRGKGFVGGKMTVCLGRPADQSIMVVKFLGTFSGLGNAEKLHKYFAENKRGRVDFEGVRPNNGKSNNMVEDIVVEQLLYGYMGIAEDLDGVDFNTKKYCLIKSKKEIMDWANAPVKPDDI